MTEHNHPKFAIWLAKLESRSAALYREHKKLTVVQIRDDIDTCNSFLEMLTEIAESDRIPITEFLPTIRTIAEQLRTVEMAARTKSTPAWKRLLLGIANAVNFVSALIGLGPIIPTQLLLGDGGNR